MCPPQDRVSRSSGKRIANMRVPGIISAIKRTKVSLPSFLPSLCVMEYVVYASTRFNVFIIKRENIVSRDVTLIVVTCYDIVLVVSGIE